MEFAIMAFMYWIFNLFFPKKDGQGTNDLEDGAAYFFSHPDLDQNRDEVNDDYDNGPEW